MEQTLPRITARVDEETQTLLTRAAAVSGIRSINAFVVSAAVSRAREILDREQTMTLNEQDARMLIEALDAPADPNEKLRAAFEFHTKQSEE